MTDKNLLLQDDVFAPPVPDTLEHLPSFYCANVKQEIDPLFAAAHYGNDLKPDHAVSCDVKSTLRLMAERTHTAGPRTLAAHLRGAASHVESLESKITLLESESEQLRMSVHNARFELGEASKDAARMDWIEEMTIDLLAKDSPNGEDRGDTYFTVIQHHMGKPYEREIGYGATARSAIDAAMTKDAA